MNRTVIFILSEKHSGSTWLSYVLGSHSQASNLGEYYRVFVDRSQVECNVCRAQGRDECAVLHGIQETPVDLAYDFAFERFGSKVLIDAGKELSWLNKVLTIDHAAQRIKMLAKNPLAWLAYERRRRHYPRERFQYKVVHLVRDPRGWFASEKRRGKADVGEAMRRWNEYNQNIRELVDKFSLPSITVFYDELASKPELFFPPLCEFVGIEYEPDMLNYWKFEHHGTSLNGASFNVIGANPNVSIKTADDRYYQDNIRKTFYDQRWKQQLDSDEIRAIEHNPMACNWLRELGRQFEGLAHLG